VNFHVSIKHLVNCVNFIESSKQQQQKVQKRPKGSAWCINAGAFSGSLAKTEERETQTALLSVL